MRSLFPVNVVPDIYIYVSDCTHVFDVVFMCGAQKDNHIYSESSRRLIFPYTSNHLHIGRGPRAKMAVDGLTDHT